MDPLVSTGETGGMMHEREFRAFVSVAEIGRMDQAARVLGYSQPAISYQIKCLEQVLGIKLFTRDSTGARLTREGRMILPSARAVLALIDSMKDVCAPS
ncbi:MULTISPECIES: LysR family transcriptional regulator [unclassified Streptomyces]|uniref:LysR family transcriptional regulator n=1 Tax=Streptomyces sp. NBRC 14336 TaxID=3030992 RepID=UPI002552D0A3|nr:LysR family transcriptional regulator [Streptomyces sp. NBRC 14336]WBO80841.1 LysR family transcriptional regulator [Streptomyces sp. SBE_14.2]